MNMNSPPRTSSVIAGDRVNFIRRYLPRRRPWQQYSGGPVRRAPKSGNISSSRPFRPPDGRTGVGPEEEAAMTTTASQAAAVDQRAREIEEQMTDDERFSLLV